MRNTSLTYLFVFFLLHVSLSAEAWIGKDSTSMKEYGSAMIFLSNSMSNLDKRAYAYILSANDTIHPDKKTTFCFYFNKVPVGNAVACGFSEGFVPKRQEVVIKKGEQSSIILLMEDRLDSLKNGATKTPTASKPADSALVKEYGSAEVTLYNNLNELNDNLDVYLISQHDTIRADARNGNHFTFSKVPVGKIMAYGFAEGFAPKVQAAEIRKGQETKVWMSITDRVVNLDGVMVKGHAPSVVQKGDTIVFNPAGVQLLEGDMARQMMEQMPGVKLDDNQFSINDKQVESSYVDGKKLFGDNPTTALDHVEANDVVKIKAYEEEEHSNRKGKKGRKKMVVNIETKSKMVDSRDGQLMAGLGRTPKNGAGNITRNRYMAGGAFNFFSEKFIINFNLMYNNENLPSNMPQDFLQEKRSPFSNYGEAALADVSVRKVIGDEMSEYTRFYGEYKFTRKTNEDYIHTDRQYLNDATLSGYEDHTGHEDANNQHNVIFQMMSDYKKTGEISLEYQYGSNHSRTSDHSESVLKSVDVTTNTISDLTDKNHGKSHNLDFGYILPMTHWDIMFSQKCQWSDDSGKSRRNYLTQGTNTLRTFIPTDNDGRTLSTEIRIDKNLSEKKRNSIGIVGQVSADRSRQCRISWNELTGELDSVNTYSYKKNNVATHLAASFGWEYNPESMLSIFLGWDHTRVKDRSDAIGKYESRFNLPYASVHLDHSSKNWNLIAQYDLKGIVPNSAQLRPVLDNQNINFLSSGNPFLKGTQEHKLDMHLVRKLGINGRNLIFDGSFDIKHNSVVSRTLFFDEDTYLNQWHYTAPANSQFSTFDNTQGEWSYRLSLSSTQPINKWKSTLLASFAFNRSNMPYYLSTERDLMKTATYRGSLTMNLGCIPKTRITLNYIPLYSQAKTNLSDRHDWSMSNKLTARIVVKPICKYFFANVFYTFEHRNFSADRPSLTQNIVNIYAGMNLFHRQAELSITAYDIFNGRKTLHAAAAQSNYVAYTDRTDNGRFFTVNFVWRIRKVRSNNYFISRGMNF